MGQKKAPTPEQRERFVLALISLFNQIDRVDQEVVQGSDLTSKMARLNKSLRLAGNVDITALGYQGDHGYSHQQEAYEEALRRFEKGEGQS